MQPSIKTAYEYLDQNLPAQALTIHTGLLQQGSPDAEIYVLEGCIRWVLGENALAQAAFQQALLLDPHFAPTIANLAFLNMYGAEILTLLINAVKQRPRDAIFRYALGAAFQQRGCFAEAERCHYIALELDPYLKMACYALSLVQLTKGDFTYGWRNFEARTSFFKGDPEINKPVWHGEYASDKVLLVEFEQGYGDFFQFVRYIEWARSLVKTIILGCVPNLLTLCQNIKGVDFVVTKPITLAFDLRCYLLSLPYILGEKAPETPAHIPYITPDQGLVQKWQTKLDELEENRQGLLRVGLVWAGNPRKHDFAAHAIDRQRSTTLTAFTPLAEVSGVNFFNLQKDQPYCDQTWDCDETWADSLPPLLRPMPFVTDFADTAALISQLDLVICVDTAIAHLAGAIGKEVWVLSRFAACWRWMGDRKDSPWYPTLTHYKQSQPDDWAELIERVKQDLIPWRDKKLSL